MYQVHRLYPPPLPLPSLTFSPSSSVILPTSSRPFSSRVTGSRVPAASPGGCLGLVGWPLRYAEMLPKVGNISTPGTPFIHPVGFIPSPSHHPQVRAYLQPGDPERTSLSSGHNPRLIPWDWRNRDPCGRRWVAALSQGISTGPRELPWPLSRSLEKVKGHICFCTVSFCSDYYTLPSQIHPGNFNI